MIRWSAGVAIMVDPGAAALRPECRVSMHVAVFASQRLSHYLLFRQLVEVACEPGRDIVIGDHKDIFGGTISANLS